MGLYSKDTATKMDLVAGWQSMVLTVGSKQVHQRKQIGKSVWSIALQSPPFRLPFWNGLPLKIVLHQHTGSFVLMTDDASRDCRVRTIKTQLCVRYIKLSDEKYRNIHNNP